MALAGLTALWLAAERGNSRAQRNGALERRARYRADITAAAGALQLSQTETARRWLESSPEEYRNWEWRYLASQIDNSRASFRPRGARPELIHLSPDCSRVIYATGSESILHLRDAAREREIAVQSGHDGTIVLLASSPSGSRVASSSADGTVRVWDGSTGQALAVLRDCAQPVAAMTWSGDAARLAIQTPRLDVEVWDVVHGVRISTLKDVEELRFARLSPNGKLLAAGGSSSAQLWDVDAGTKLGSLSSENRHVVSLAFSADGARLAGGTMYPQSRVWIWDTATGRALAKMDGHSNTVSAVEFSPDGRRLVSTSHDQTVVIWDSATGQSLSILQGHFDWVTAASFHPDSRRLVSASRDGSLRLWDTRDQKLIGVLRGETHVERFAISQPGGSVVASVGGDGTVRFWDLERIEDGGVLGRHTSFVYDVAFSPSGQTVASAGWDGAVRLWNARTGRPDRVLHHPTEIVNSVTFDPDGRHVASVGRDHQVYFWDLATGQITARVQLVGGPMSEERISFAPRGGLAASTGGRDGSIRLFTLSEEFPYVDLLTPGAGANDSVFSPDGSRLVCGYSDGMIRIWDVGSRVCTSGMARS